MTGNLIKIPTDLLVRTSGHISLFILFLLFHSGQYTVLSSQRVPVTFCGKILVMKPQMFLFVVIDVTCDKPDTHTHKHTHTFNLSPVLFLLLNRNVWAK